MSQRPLPTFEPASSWTPPSLASLPSWAEARRVGVDIETKDPSLVKLGPGVRRGAQIVGVSFAIEDGPGAYLPIAHAPGGNLPREHVLAYLRDQARVFKGELCGANLAHDLDFFAEAGVDFRPRMHRDVQVAEPLIYELYPDYDLDAIARRRGLPGKDERLLREAAAAYRVHPKKGLWQLHPKFVAPYGEYDARSPLLILRKQERDIDEQDLWQVYDLESRLLPCLVRMTRLGIRISTDRLEQVERWALGIEREALGAVHTLTGVRLTEDDTNKVRALGRALDAAGVKYPLTTPPDGSKAKPQPSLKNPWLKAQRNPVCDALLRAKKFNKLRTTFCESIREHLVGDRIHCSFRQLRGTQEGRDEEKGARYGRISCMDPNMQQQPSPERDPDVAGTWRTIYLPDEGKRWACLDFSQQEPRWLTHYAELAGCAKAKAAADRYRNDPSTDNHTMMSEMVFGREFVAADLDIADQKDPRFKRAKELRGKAKIIFLGLCYGMGGGKLCRSLGLPTERKWSKRMQRDIDVAGPEGAELFERFHRGVPYIRELSDRCTELVKASGYIFTAMKRRCHFPKGKDGYEWLHKGLNRLIQGSSADQAKKAIVDADDAGYRIQLPVHDELDLSFERDEEVLGLAEIMKTAVPCNLPHKVDIEVGPSWGELRKLKT